MGLVIWAIPSLSVSPFIREWQQLWKSSELLGHTQPPVATRSALAALVRVFPDSWLLSAYCVPQVVQMKCGMAHHPLGRPHTPGVISSTEFPAGSRK